MHTHTHVLHVTSLPNNCLPYKNCLVLDSIEIFSLVRHCITSVFTATITSQHYSYIYILMSSAVLLSWAHIIFARGRNQKKVLNKVNKIP